MIIRLIRTVAAGSVVVGVWVVGCGGTSASGVGSADGGSDAATDATSSMEGGGDDGSTGSDSPTGDVATTGDTGSAETGGDGGCTGTGATCRQCCRTGNAAGYKKLVAAELTCACKPSVCGPVEGGAGDAGGADGSDLGVGACASTCATQTLPDTTCDKCLGDATGTMANPGECYTDVSAACGKDADCVAYVTCVTGCQ
jgi:hypothetical protein